jgi:hypothetical protein
MRTPIYIDAPQRELLVEATNNLAQVYDALVDDTESERERWAFMKRAQDFRALRDLFEDCDEVLAYR